MGLPFTVVSGAVFITDQDGDICEVVQRSNNSNALATQSELVGTDTLGAWRSVNTVVRTDGVRALAVDSRTVVESTFGFDQSPDSYFRIINTGAVGDQWTIFIKGTNNDPSNPDRDVPDFTYIHTVAVDEAGDELLLRDRIIQALNANSTFKQICGMKAQNATDRAIIHIQSDFYSLGGEYWERPFAGDFSVTVTGSGQVFLGFDNFISRSKPVSIARDIDSPHRLGLFGITGEVRVTAKDLDDLFIENAKENFTGGPDMGNANGSIANPAIWGVSTSTNTDIFIQELRFYGQGNGIKYGNFLNMNNSLNNGIQITIKSNDTTTVLPLIKSTEDFKNKFAFGDGAGGFKLDIASGRDDFLAVFTFENPFTIKVQGTFTVDDFIEIQIRDNINVGSLEFIAKGFEKDP